jgi:hypothetical protein
LRFYAFRRFQQRHASQFSISGATAWSNILLLPPRRTIIPHKDEYNRFFEEKGSSLSLQGLPRQ